VPQPIDVYAWRNAIMSDNGPTNPLARLVLMAVSLHMKADGTGAWPAQKLLAVRACMGERSVRRHLEIAERLGWIERTRTRRDKGRAWYRTEYAACVPDDVYVNMPERPWESDPTWRREPAIVAATHQQIPNALGVSSDDNRPTSTRVPANGARQPATQARVPANGARQPATQARVPANGDTDNRPSFGRLTTPRTTPRTPPKNSSHEGAALTRNTAMLESDLKASIRKYRSIGFGDSEIVKALAQFGVTIEEVRRWRKEA
jgi:Helix-turn-helix domain